MAKIKPIYLIGAAALAAYLFKDKLFGAKPSGEVDQAEAAQPDTVIDTTKTGQSVSQAIATAKQIAQGVKDIKVLIKTPKGQKDLSYTQGAKKPRRRKRRSKKAKLSFGPLQSSFTPFAPLSDQTTTTDYASYAPGYTGEKK
jgi:hypothetical protein